MGGEGEAGLLFLLVLLLSLLAFSHAVEGSSTWKLSKEEDLEIERQLRTLNKPPVKSFKTEYGDIFDCVDIYKQPALSHPLLRNHTIQMKPFTLPKGLGDETSSRKKPLKTVLGEKCPPGTVIIRRTQKDDLIRAKKHDPYYHSHIVLNDGNHYAGITVISANPSDPLRYYGAQATMDVFSLSGISINQASAAMISLTKGERGPNDKLNTIQFGWHIFPGITGDNLTRLFTHWTSDGYQKTGCFNQLCKGFVQISETWTPGMALPIGEAPFKFSAYKEYATEHWLMVVGEEEVIGYWPKEIFNNMADNSQIQVSGLVYSPFDEPSPPMGNGILPGRDPTKACGMKQIKLLNEEGHFEQVDPIFVIPILDIPDFYNVMYEDDDVEPEDRYQIFFGGPGGYKRP